MNITSPKLRFIPLLAVGLVCFGTPGWADDAPADKPIKTHKQLMRECIAKHKAEDSSASPADRKKACAQEIKSYNDHPSAPTPSSAPPT